MIGRLGLAAGVAAAVMVVVVAWSELSSVGPPSTPPASTLLVKSSPTATKSVADPSPLGAADLARIVAGNSNAPTDLLLHQELTGEDALSATGLVPDGQRGVTGAVLSTWRGADDEPFETAHAFTAQLASRYVEEHGQYGSLAVAFATTADAIKAFAAASDVLESGDGWALEPEADGGFSRGDWVPADGVRMVDGSDFGYPIVRAFLWRVENVLLLAVDMHVYDLPEALPLIAQGMDARARSAEASTT